MTRQTKLLKYLRKRYREDPKRFITQEEICRDIDEYELDLNPRSHNRCISIWKDVQLINSDPEVHSVIYYKNNCCKIATKKEARICADRILKAGCAQMKRYWNIIDKARMEGQMKLETREDLQNLLERV